MNIILLQDKLRSFIKEDLSFGDLSAEIFDRQAAGTMTLLAKEAGYFSGCDVITEGFQILGQLDVTLFVNDGDKIDKGTKLAEIKGPIRQLLSTERTVLNIIQRMSGITTMTKRYVSAVAGNCEIADTRKTTPGLSMFEKYAVRVGGGRNHRRTLNDGMMLKDNHIGYMGSITEAVKKAQALQGHMDKIEVEIEDEAMLAEAIAAGADIIMFDNCTPEFIKTHISTVPEHIITEASGGINLQTVSDYAQTGVQYISVGELFYGAHALDISAEVKYD